MKDYPWSEEQLHNACLVAFDAEMKAYSENLVPHTFSKKFEKNMRKLLRAQTNIPTKRIAFWRQKRLAVAIIVAAMIGFATTVMAVEPLRLAFLEFFGDHFRVSKQEIITEELVDTTFIPLSFETPLDGYTLLLEDFNEQVSKYILQYQTTSGDFLLIDQYFTEDGIFAGTEDKNYETIYIHDYECHLIADHSGTYLTMMTQKYAINIFFTGDTETLFEIAENIILK